MEPGVDTDSLGQAEAFQVTGAACGVVNSLNLYVDASSTAGMIVVGLYADKAGNPGSLLAQGSTTAPVAGAWNTITVPPVSVTAGIPYWIAVLGTTSGTVAYRDAPRGCTSKTSASTTLTSLPSNWTTGASYPSCPLSAYAGPSATAISTPSTTAISTYTISGAISPASDAAGSVVALSGAASASTTPNASGVYSFTGLAGGSYTVTPTSPEVSFSPVSEPVTVSGASVGAVNFSATATATTNTIFYDDFSGTTLNTNDWVTLNRAGDASNSELEYYLPANTSVANSDLSIMTQVQSQSGYNYTSSMVQWQSFAFTYGTITVSAKMGGGTGPWPAIWMLGANCQVTNVTTANNTGTCNWPAAGSSEIDIAEFVNSQYTAYLNNIYSTCTFSQQANPGGGFNATTAFHVYEVDWTAGSIVWKVDGVT
ncbi:MAG: family 16 glycosylhydrolase, partial [Steroidobacteraceae bacterium]